MTNLNIRSAKPEDMDFVMSNWKRSWRVSPWAGCIRNDEYYASISSTIEGLVARGAEILVAELGGRLLGFICSEQLEDGACCVHYIYVKDPFIRMGIGEKLVDAAPGSKPGFFTFRYHQVCDACKGFKHAPEIARRK